MAIKRVNKTLCVILSLLIMVVVVSYYFVISCEMKLNDLSRQTVILNNENEELQNKLDSLKSFNNVDKTLQQNNMLQRAGQVIETPEITIDTAPPFYTPCAACAGPGPGRAPRWPSAWRSGPLYPR